MFYIFYVEGIHLGCGEKKPKKILLKQQTEIEVLYVFCMKLFSSIHI